MTPSLFRFPNGAAPRLLLLGAHSDDIEIGCGATLQVLAAMYPRMELRWTVLSAPGERAAETKHAARLLLGDNVSVQTDLHDFRESYFPYVGVDVKECMDAIGREFNPDIVFTHCEHDKHQDHRIVSELTYNTYRDHLILEYEVMKYDGDLGSPNVFVPVTPQQMETKVHALLTAFRSQSTKYWFTKDTFMALPRLRGVESRSPTGFAEAFYCRKLRLFA
jgi:LmbE family N-acetylglucosaminyl deacetylase